ncbi:MAG: amidohydrolase family protein [Armatimonadetes bacterium]|nr:amidohydrolase family protein [Armatimonadota bacterium]
MVIDAHVYLGRSLFGWGQDGDEILSRMDSLGINSAVLCTARPESYHLEEGNSTVAGEVRKHPERFYGFVRVDPWREAAHVELKRGIENLGLVGLFLHPWEENFPVNHDRVVSLLSQLGNFKKRVPVMISGGHPRVSEPSQIADLVSRFPDLSFIVTSGGQINISGEGLLEARLLIRDHPNVVMDTSGVYREDFIEGIVREFGGRRVVFGSASPQYDQRLEWQRIRLAYVTEEDRAWISGKTIQSLLTLTKN